MNSKQQQQNLPHGIRHTTCRYLTTTGLTQSLNGLVSVGWQPSAAGFVYRITVHELFGRRTAAYQPGQKSQSQAYYSYSWRSTHFPLPHVQLGFSLCRTWKRPQLVMTSRCILMSSSVRDDPMQLHGFLPPQLAHCRPHTAGATPANGPGVEWLSHQNLQQTIRVLLKVWVGQKCFKTRPPPNDHYAALQPRQWSRLQKLPTLLRERNQRALA